MAEKGNIKELFDNEMALSRPRSLAEEAADALRAMILLEKLPPGSPLPERDLSDALQISRTPVREAFRQLEVEGLVEYSRSRRPRVANPSLQELTQYLMVLGVLEGFAGEQVCLHATDQQIAEIAELNERLSANDGKVDPLDFFEIDMAFHNAIVKAADHPPLIETHRQYNARLWRARFISSKRKGGQGSRMLAHQAIVDALQKRDPQAATATLRHHMENAVANIKTARAERNYEATLNEQ
ncbi:MAG: GntR family transcriptional regulator [Opitutaceae bacterium]|nr:GntR family transcriptional regulator [Opitutaceae bacterium]